jgi:hypothetical protein
MQFDAGRVKDNVARATTEDLLDRATVYRSGMEPEALEIIEAELNRRGMSSDQIAAHAERRSGVVVKDGAVARPCSYCVRPAVDEGMRWHWLFGKIPLFPRWMYWCEEHGPK